jgi:NADPH-dependent ferric siderophore reductase
MATLVGAVADPADECLVARWGDDVTVHLFARDKDCRLPRPDAAIVERDGRRVLCARTMLIDLAPHDRRIVPAAGPGWPMTLLPGDEVELLGPVSGPFDRSGWGCTHWA